MYYYYKARDLLRFEDTLPRDTTLYLHELSLVIWKAGEFIPGYTHSPLEGCLLIIQQHSPILTLIPSIYFSSWNVITLHLHRIICTSDGVWHGVHIRIYHECEGRIEKSVPRIDVWHHEWWQTVIHEGQIFLSYHHTNNDSFFLLTTVFIYSFVYLLILK